MRVSLLPFPGALPVNVTVEPLMLALCNAVKLHSICAHTLPVRQVPLTVFVESGCETLEDALAWATVNAVGIMRAAREEMLRPMFSN